VRDLWAIFGLCDQQMTTHYASRRYQPQTGSLPAATKIDLRPARPYRAVVMAVEADQYVLTIASPNLLPDDGDQFDQLLRNLLPQQIAATVLGGQPAGPVIISASPLVRRGLDQSDRLPRNVVALGDSLCSFDPLEGQGFEAAVREAGVLSQLLGEQHPYADNGQPIELSQRYFRAAARIVDGAWTMGA
jgi:2-polyprenyl-6-methoxyphenol hydroxylase-like FAD-dependent oxidoreductase